MKFQIQSLLIIFTLFLASFSPSTVATAGKANPSIAAAGQKMSAERTTRPNTAVSNIAAEHELSQQAPFSRRERLLATYMSVSYPLAAIHITSPYGYRADPFTGKRTLHNGIDLRASNRSEVYAMLAGRVISVGHDRASGNYLTIQSGSYLITYCHLSCVLVRPGSAVAPGSLVALSGNTGRSTGSHLHISVKHITTTGIASPINPILLLDFVRSTRAAAIASLLAIDHVSTLSQ